MSDVIRDRLSKFARDHKVGFEDHGEVGFARPCVGFVKGDGYIEYNPTAYVYKPGDLNPSDFVRVEGFDDRRFLPPDGVEDAYHKHDCLAVLVKPCASCEDKDEPCREHYNHALYQLALWADHLDAIGVEVAQYDRGARGIHAVVNGTHGWAIRVAAKGGGS